MKIGQLPFGAGHAPIVVAECGINDGGDPAVAVRLVEALGAVDCRAVKWQQHDPTESTNQKPWMHYDTLPTAVETARRFGMAIGCTAFSVASLDRIAKAGIDWIKLGSGETSNAQLIMRAARHSADLGIPLVLSSGMHTVPEVHAAVRLARKYTDQVAVLECSSIYPAAPGEIRLGRMSQLGCSVYGLSDHSLSLGPSVAAVALGASMIERHVTLGRDLDGPDHASALVPSELAALQVAVRDAWAAMQTRDTIGAREQATAAWARSSVYAARDIEAGQVIGPADVVARRPWTTGALPGTAWPNAIGRTARRRVPALEPLTAADLAD